MDAAGRGWWDAGAHGTRGRHATTRSASTAARPAPTRARPASPTACTARPGWSTTRAFALERQRLARARRWPARSCTSATSARSRPAGTFDGAIEHLDHLVELGVDAIELMPVAEFPGRRGWGYDGVDLFAPHHAYGGPDGLKRLVDAAPRPRASA